MLSTEAQDIVRLATVERPMEVGLRSFEILIGERPVVAPRLCSAIEVECQQSEPPRESWRLVGLS